MKESERIRLESQMEENDIKSFALSSKSHKVQKSEFFRENLLPIIYELKYVVDEYHPNSFRFRLEEGKNFVDYFPMSGRMFIKDKNKWINVNNQICIQKIKENLK